MHSFLWRQMDFLAFLTTSCPAPRRCEPTTWGFLWSHLYLLTLVVWNGIGTMTPRTASKPVIRWGGSEVHQGSCEEDKEVRGNKSLGKKQVGSTGWWRPQGWKGADKCVTVYPQKRRRKYKYTDVKDVWAQLLPGFTVPLRHRVSETNFFIYGEFTQ